MAQEDKFWTLKTSFVFIGVGLFLMGIVESDMFQVSNSVWMKVLINFLETIGALFFLISLPDLIKHFKTR